VNPLFTIGHSSHALGEFLHLLELHQIGVIADVRSQPYSRRYPHFSKRALEPSLAGAGVSYIFLGRELGARRNERECYVNGTVSFDLVALSPLFASGLARLQEEILEHRVALLCAEKDPLDCHRTILVARHAASFAKISHILAGGTLESHKETERRLLERYAWNDPDMFCSRENQLAKAYARREAEIAWSNVKPAFSDEL
jgi:uncharacterized protein (DUF488 family)